MKANRLVAIGFVVTATVSGCGGQVTSGEATKQTGTSASATSAKPVDANAAFTKAEAAREPVSCTDALAGTLTSAYTAKVPALRENAQKFLDLVNAWDKQMGGIEFPADATATVTHLHDLAITELADLKKMATVPDGANPQDLIADANTLNFDETSIRVDLDTLSGILGHPKPASFVAANQLELAHGAFYKDVTPVGQMFNDAVAKKDLAGAKAANGIEEEAAQRYLDTLGKITFPPGFEGQLKALQDALHSVIDFDRKQVDVPTVADIVPTGDQGSPEGIASETTKGALMDALMTDAMKAGALPKC